VSGPLAQLVEQWTLNPLVRGSSPRGPTISTALGDKYFRNITVRGRGLGIAIDGYIRDELPNETDQKPKARLLRWKRLERTTEFTEISPRWSPNGRTSCRSAGRRTSGMSVLISLTAWFA
jgi:hypothetical protein